MKPITQTIKSNIRFQTMRARYLSDRKKKHPTTQLYGQRNKSVVSWGFNEHILNKHIWPQIARLLKQGKYLGDFLLVNDYTFEATNYLISRINPTAITVAFIVEDDTDKCRIQKWIATYFEGTDQLTIVYIYKDNSVQKIKELKMYDKFNLIISNLNSKRYLSFSFGIRLYILYILDNSNSKYSLLLIKKGPYFNSFLVYHLFHFFCTSNHYP